MNGKASQSRSKSAVKLRGKKSSLSFICQTTITINLFFLSFYEKDSFATQKKLKINLIQSPLHLPSSFFFLRSSFSVVVVVVVEQKSLYSFVVDHHH